MTKNLRFFFDNDIMSNFGALWRRIALNFLFLSMHKTY